MYYILYSDDAGRQTFEHEPTLDRAHEIIAKLLEKGYCRDDITVLSENGVIEDAPPEPAPVVNINCCCHAHPGRIMEDSLEILCCADGFRNDQTKPVTADICQNCDRFRSKYIQYPLEISAIKTETGASMLYPAGQLVGVRPADDQRTYLGVLLGELPIGIVPSYNETSKILTCRYMQNPAIYVPELKRIVYGCESWWTRIESEDDLKQITDEAIDNTWYVKLAREIFQDKEKIT